MARARVECYSGYTYAQEPRALHWQGRRWEVTAILDRWRQPTGPVFIVRSADRRLFRLSYNEGEGVWDAALL